MKNINLIIGPLIIIFVAVLLRIFPHPPNFAPIAAMALFGGAYLPRRYAFILPILVMFLSDLFIGFHSQVVFVYGSFMLTVLIGMWISKNKNIKNVFLGAVGASILFFLITNFGVWFIGPSSYSPNLSGLIESYVMGFPFFRNTLMGDLFYTGIFFSSYEFAKNLVLNKSLIFKK